MTFVASVFQRVRLIVRFQPHDMSTTVGRSRERYRRVTFTTAGALGAGAIAMLTSLVSVPLIFCYLGAERYGLWMVLLSFIAAMAFADLGIGNGVMNAVSEPYGKDDRGLLWCMILPSCHSKLLSYPFLSHQMVQKTPGTPYDGYGIHCTQEACDRGQTNPRHASAAG